MTHAWVLATATLVGSSVLLLGGPGGGGATAATTYYCFGQEATIVGTTGDDVLVGSGDAADVIVGLGGNDSISGFDPVNEDIYAGSPLEGDRLCGGAGRDDVRGAMGEDRIQGGPGIDWVGGSFGYDVSLRGGGGNDEVDDCDSEYTGGARRMSGGPGDDRLCVNVDSTHMFGDGGNDVLIDLDCNVANLLSGGSGSDRIASHANSFEGGDCGDWDGADVSDRIRGGDGTDSAEVSSADVVSEVESVAVTQ